MKTKTITARIDKDLSDEIDYIKQYLDASSTSLVLKEAIHTFYEICRKKSTPKSPYEVMKKLNLIGSIETEPGLSSNYKKALAKSLSKKI